MSQGSILVPILFNIFSSTLFLFVTESKLPSFTDEKATLAVPKDIGKRLKVLEDENEVAINWFNTNDMIATPGKFQIMIYR